MHCKPPRPGLSFDEITLVLAVNAPGLMATYGTELQSGGIKASARVAESPYRQATGEGRQAVTAAIFWLKTRARWKETWTHELTGPEGAPIEPSNMGLSGILCARPVSSLTDEPFAEDDGELGLGLEPFARRSLPFLGRVVQHQI